MIQIFSFLLLFAGAHAGALFVDGPVYLGHLEVEDEDYDPQLFAVDQSARLRDQPGGAPQRLLRQINDHYLRHNFGPVARSAVFALPNQLTVHPGGASLRALLLTQDYDIRLRSRFGLVRRIEIEVIDGQKTLLRFPADKFSLWRLTDQEPAMSLDADLVADVRFHYPAEWMRAQAAGDLHARVKFSLSDERFETVTFDGLDAARLLRIELNKPLPRACEKLML